MNKYESLNVTANVSVTLLYTQDINSYGNITEDWYKEYQDYFEQNESYTANAVDIVAIVLCIIGIIANILSITIVASIHNKLSAHLKLIISLCCSDCIILIPTFLSKIFPMIQHSDVCVNVALRLVADLALLATLLNLLAIAIDHYIAIIKPLIYKKEMTNIRGICVVLIIWLASALAIAVEIIMGVVHRLEMEPVCEAIAFDKTNSEFGIVVFIFVVLLVIFVIYGRIYICVVRNRITHRKTRHHQRDSSNVKALVTTSLFVLVFVLFWTPIGVFNVYMFNKDVAYILNNLQKITLIGDILYVVLLLNAVSDPFIYTLRLPQIYRKCFIFRAAIRRQSTRTMTLTSEV